MGWRASQKLIHRWKIVSGDNVMVTRGKDRGGTGVVKHVIHSQNHSIIEGKWSRNISSKGKGMKMGFLQLKPPFMSQMFRFFDPVTRRPCKVGIRYLEDGTKVRVSRGIGTSGSIIHRSEILKIRTTPRPTVGTGQSLQPYMCCVLVCMCTCA